MADRIIVHGASGGLGVSTLAVALGVVAARAGRQVAVVDGVPTGGGLDVTACVEHLPGLRWGDLVLARGAIDGRALVAGLPVGEGVAVLAASPGGPPSDAVVAATLAGLSDACELVVVDAGAGGELGGFVAGGEGDLVLLVVSTTARGIADATAAVSRSAGASGPDPLPRLVVRGDATLAESLADHLATPLLDVWPDDGRVSTHERRGVTPGVRRGPLATLAGRVLAEVAVPSVPDPLLRGRAATAGRVRSRAGGVR